MEKNKESEILAKWDNERSMYDAWGKVVATTLKEAIEEKISPDSIDLFLRIPITSRTKEANSLITKALYRKNYADPYNDIEDKVGIRIIVLRSEEIRIISETVEECDIWDATKSRDFDEDRLKNPFVFDYQSVHYVVRNKCAISHKDDIVPANTPCEIQIRTLLQHAHSELTHDTIYKPNVAASPEVKRAAAKSMALIEATDDYFNDVYRSISLAARDNKEINRITDELYKRLLGSNGEPTSLNEIIIDHYRQWIPQEIENTLENFFQKEKSFLIEDIRNNANLKILYKQPGILLVYWSVKEEPKASFINNPLSETELAPIYSILGEPWPEL